MFKNTPSLYRIHSGKSRVRNTHLWETHSAGESSLPLPVSARPFVDRICANLASISSHVHQISACSPDRTGLELQLSLQGQGHYIHYHAFTTDNEDNICHRLYPSVFFPYCTCVTLYLWDANTIHTCWICSSVRDTVSSPSSGERGACNWESASLI